MDLVYLVGCFVEGILVVGGCRDVAVECGEISVDWGDGFVDGSFIFIDCEGVSCWFTVAVADIDGVGSFSVCDASGPNAFADINGVGSFSVCDASGPNVVADGDEACIMYDIAVTAVFKGNAVVAAVVATNDCTTVKLYNSVEIFITEASWIEFVVITSGANSAVLLSIVNSVNNWFSWIVTIEVGFTDTKGDVGGG